MPISKIDVLLDVDGVVANFVGAVFRSLSYCPLLGARQFFPEDIKTYDILACLPVDLRPWVSKALMSRGFCESIKPYDGAQEFVAALREDYNVYFCTAPLEGNPYWYQERAIWLMRYFSAKQEDIIFAKRKYLIDAPVLIEDSTANLNAWIEPRPTYKTTGILLNRPWNDMDKLHTLGIRVDNYTEILACIRGDL